jgi:hypothetical protein
VIAGIPIGDGEGMRIEVRSVFSRHGKGGRVHVHLPRRDAKALASLARQSGEEGGRIVLVEPVQRSSQAVVMQHLGRDAGTQQVFDRLGREELRDQIQAPVAEPAPVEDHRHRGGAHTDLLLTRSRQRIQVLRQPDLAADARHNAQMVQSLDTHAPHDAPFRSLGLMLPEMPKRPHLPLRNVG